MSTLSEFWLTLLVVGLAWAILPEVSARNRLVRCVLAWAYILLAVRYLIWRGLFSLPDDDALEVALGYALLGIEVWGLFLSARFILASAPMRSRSAEADRHTSWWGSDDDAPLVDVLIPTYNENWHVLERTIVGALHLDYPNYRLWILDDGNRDWLARKAEAYGVRYLSRDSNRHYKAGNLNNAYRHLLSLERQPRFIAVLDADFFAKRHFLRRTLALMVDPNTAIVQTPQHFYNQDPLQYALRDFSALPDSQNLMFEFWHPSRDEHGIATCCGTSFVLRFSALHEIGGFPQDSVSEDLLTSLTLYAHGKRTVYLHEPLSVGLAADGLKEHLGQQARWCTGLLQVGYTRFGPFSSNGMSLWQRIKASERFLEWGFFSFVRFMYLLMPPIFWFSNLTLVASDPVSFGVHFYPLWVLGFVIDAWFFRGTRLPFISEAWTVLAAPAVIQATVNGLLRRGNSAFTVTDKGRSRDRTVVHWRVLWPFALIAVLTLAGMLKSVLDPFDEIGSQNFTPVAYLWSIYNLVILFFVFLTCIEFPRQRRADRYPARESVRVEAAGRMDTALLLDLSIDGGRLRCDDELEVGGIVQVELAQVGRVRAQLVRRITTMEYGVRWMADAEQRRCLILRVYGSDAKPVRSGDVFRLIGLTFRRLAH